MNWFQLNIVTAREEEVRSQKRTDFHQSVFRLLVIPPLLSCDCPAQIIIVYQSPHHPWLRPLAIEDGKSQTMAMTGRRRKTWFIQHLCLFLWAHFEKMFHRGRERERERRWEMLSYRLIILVVTTSYRRLRDSHPLRGLRGKWKPTWRDQHLRVSESEISSLSQKIERDREWNFAASSRVVVATPLLSDLWPSFEVTRPPSRHLGQVWSDFDHCQLYCILSPLMIIDCTLPQFPSFFALIDREKWKVKMLQVIFIVTITTTNLFVTNHNWIFWFFSKCLHEIENRVSLYLARIPCLSSRKFFSPSLWLSMDAKIEKITDTCFQSESGVRETIGKWTMWDDVSPVELLRWRALAFSIKTRNTHTHTRTMRLMIKHGP